MTMEDDDLQIAEMDRELSRPWLNDLRTGSLIESARNAVSQYGVIRAVDRSGVVGELLDLLEAVTARLSAGAGFDAGFDASTKCRESQTEVEP